MPVEESEQDDKRAKRLVTKLLDKGELPEPPEYQKAYPDEVRAHAVALYLSGHGVSSAARIAGVRSGTTVLRWIQELGYPVRGKILSDAERGSNFESLLYDLASEYLKMLRMNIAIVSDPDYVEKQTPSDMAIIIGTLGDQTTRILDSIAHLRRRSEEGSPAAIEAGR